MDVSSFLDECRRSSMSDKEYEYISRLTPEQIDIVVDDSQSVLVSSAAGSGKTTVLLSKYIYLSTVKDVSSDKILFLSYNKQNVKDIENDYNRININGNICARTINSLALNIIEDAEGVWPSLLEDVEKAYDRILVDHNRAEAFLSEFTNKVKNKMGEDERFRCFLHHYYFNGIKGLNAIRNQRGENNQYITFLTDSKGRPGSCRSVNERVVFEWLALHHVDFEYEYADKESHVRPDFWIYPSGGNTDPYVLEVLSSSHISEFENKTHGSKYFDNVAAKREIYGDRYIELDGSKSRDRILRDLSWTLRNKGIYFKKYSGRHLKEKCYDECIHKIITDFRKLRDWMVLRGYEPLSAREWFSQSEDDFGIFMNVIFVPLEEIYSGFLKDGNVYTDFSDSLIRAAKHLKIKRRAKWKAKYKYDYVLVDEFQDMSFARHELLLALKKNNPGMHLLAVGDDRQAIYSFSGCDLKFFRDFSKYWPGARLMTMNKTFRFGEPCAYVSSKFVNENGGVSTSLTQGNGSRTDIVLSLINTSEDVFQEYAEYIVGTFKEILSKSCQDNKPKVLVAARNNSDLNEVKNMVERISSDKHISFNHVDITYSTIHRAKGKTFHYLFLTHADLLPYALPVSRSSIKDRLVRWIEEKYGAGDCDRLMREEESRLAYVCMTRAKFRSFLLFSKETKLYTTIKNLLADFETPKEDVNMDISGVAFLFDDNVEPSIKSLKNLCLEPSFPVLYLLVQPQKLKLPLPSSWMGKQMRNLRILCRDDLGFYQWLSRSRDALKNIICSENSRYPEAFREYMLVLVRFLNDL